MANRLRLIRPGYEGACVLLRHDRGNNIISLREEGRLHRYHEAEGEGIQIGGHKRIVTEDLTDGQ